MIQFKESYAELKKRSDKLELDKEIQEKDQALLNESLALDSKQEAEKTSREIDSLKLQQKRLQNENEELNL